MTHTRPRMLLLLPAGLALLLGLDAALLLLDVPAPLHLDRLPEVHGVLLVLGFVGTVISLERAVGLGRPVAYLAPALTGLGGLALLSPQPRVAGGALLTAGMAALLLVYRGIWHRQPHPALVVEGAGALSGVGAAALWWRDVEVPTLLPWLVGFVVLTIAGERLELARVGGPGPVAEGWLLGLAGGLLVGLVASLLWPEPGTVLLGAAMLGLVGWLLAFDVARRLVRSTGLPRFSAASILAGYAWLALAGGVWLLAGPVDDGAGYDAVVHAVFLGFTLSMIMAHAPVILPAVLRRPLPYRAAMWAPAVLLQVSLVLRVVADAHGWVTVWQAAGVLNVVAVLGFLVVAAGASIASARPGPAQPHSARPIRPEGAAR